MIGMTEAQDWCPLVWSPGLLRDRQRSLPERNRRMFLAGSQCLSSTPPVRPDLYVYTSGPGKIMAEPRVFCSFWSMVEGGGPFFAQRWRSAFFSFPSPFGPGFLWGEPGLVGSVHRPAPRPGAFFSAPGAAAARIWCARRAGRPVLPTRDRSSPPQRPPAKDM